MASCNINGFPGQNIIIKINYTDIFRCSYNYVNDNGNVQTVVVNYVNLCGFESINKIKSYISKSHRDFIRYN